MSKLECDLLVIGAGPGGYVAAIAFARSGLRVICVDKRSDLGGTCLNVGCIPSKALLQSSHHYHMASEEFEAHGIECSPVLRLDRMMERKNSVVGKLRKGIAYLFNKAGVTFVSGTASFLENNSHITKVSVLLSDGGQKIIEASRVLIATGSDAVCPPIFPVDEQVVVTSTGALSFSAVPEHLVVVGGGVIGLELGAVWSRLGSKVSVVELGERLLPSFDKEVSDFMAKFLKKEGVSVYLKHLCAQFARTAQGCLLTLKREDGSELQVDCSHVLVAVGRSPHTSSLGLDAVGMKRTERGFIVVNDRYETSCSGIYAIGDCVEGAMLAHRASEDALRCVQLLTHKSVGSMPCIPSVVYTYPEIASVGASEDHLKKSGIAYKKFAFPYSANSRHIANGELSEGFVKILADAVSDRILGATIIAPGAGEMIHELSLALEFGASTEDIDLCCHAHPTFSEAIKEACAGVLGHAIHI